MKEKLEFDYPRTMDDAVRKAHICYQQMKKKSDGPKGDLGGKLRNFTPIRQPKVINGRSNQQRTFGKFARYPSKVLAYIENR